MLKTSFNQKVKENAMLYARAALFSGIVGSLAGIALAYAKNADETRIVPQPVQADVVPGLAPSVN